MNYDDGACVDTKPTGIKATCFINDNRGQPHFAHTASSERWWPANEGKVTLVCMVNANTISNGTKPKVH